MSNTKARSLAAETYPYELLADVNKSFNNRQDLKRKGFVAGYTAALASPPPTITAAALLEGAKRFAKEMYELDKDAYVGGENSQIAIAKSFAREALIEHLESLLLKPLEGK